MAAALYPLLPEPPLLTPHFHKCCRLMHFLATCAPTDGMKWSTGQRKEAAQVCGARRATGGLMPAVTCNMRTTGAAQISVVFMHYHREYQQ